MNKKICKISLFSMILATVATMPSDAAIKNKNANRSYAGAYQQVNAMRYAQEYADATATNATTASATDNLPVAVDDEKLAHAIINNEADAPDVSQLESCSMIYPNGVFKWAVPESGIRKNSTPQCVAVVELMDANTNTVLATTTVAAGDSMKCNIDSFPKSGISHAVLNGQIELPADEAPTIEDVTAIMNEEQKQNAGLKIVAAALVSGVAGNLLAPKEAGKSNGKIPLGTGKTQLKDTAIAATAGAGIMAASTFSGKVAGDTIKSTAVNAASGMLVGNMLAATGGGGVLATTKCSVNGTEYDCVMGDYNVVGKSIEISTDKTYIINEQDEIKECKKNSEGKIECDPYSKKITDIVIKAKSGNDTEMKEIKGNKDQVQKNMMRWCKNEDKWEKCGTNDNVNVFYEIATHQCPDNSDKTCLNANEVTQTIGAYAVFANGTLDKKSGYKEWSEISNKNHTYWKRNLDGTVYTQITESESKGQFEPKTRKASDGGLIDLSNQARIKGTVAGGATGAALGGFAGYQGAKDEISQRWLAARQEYDDSLLGFVCVTGARYLEPYNNYVAIPEPGKTEQ